MKRTSTVLLLVLVFASIVPLPSARADVGAPVEVGLLGDPKPAVVGQPFEAKLSIQAFNGGTIENFSLSDQGWSSPSDDAPSSVTLQPGETLEINISVVPVDPSQPLVVHFTLDGRNVYRALDLSMKAYRRVAFDQPLIQLSPSSGLPSSSLETQDPFGPAKASPDQYQQKISSKHSRSVTVRGRLVYYEPETVTTDAGAYGVTVRILEHNTLYDTIRAETTTDKDGYFSASFDWTSVLGTEPDIRVQFRCENSTFKVKDGAWSRGLYKWKTSLERNFDGTDLDLGELGPEEEDINAALHILTTVDRAQAWLSAHGGYTVSDATIKWPDDSKEVSFYRNGKLHIHSFDGFAKDTILHELGHHWIENYSWQNEPDYCNDICDESDPCDTGGSGGHCLWCEEDALIAWSEGFPDWFARVIHDSFEADYGEPYSGTRDYEYLGSCTDPNEPSPDHPKKIEGYSAAILQDLWDSNEESGTTWGDQIAVSPDNILETVAEDDPHRMVAFLDDYRARFGTDSYVWRTADNNGYTNLDTTPPDPPTTVVSTSHEVGVDSANPRIDLNWPDSNDDYSGPYGYSISTSKDNPDLPDKTVDLVWDGAAVIYQTDILGAGLWWVNVRARDRAGNWSSTATSVGPFKIREPLPADVTWGPGGAGWTGPLVLRDDASAGSGIVQESQFLTGDAAATYWNVATRNQGDEATSTFSDLIYVDGVATNPLQGSVLIGNIPAMSGVVALNEGPIFVRGGRHTISVHFDSSNNLPEPQEFDNIYAIQRVFEPSILTLDSPVVRSAPPDPDAGWNKYTLPNTHSMKNQDGLRINTTSGYNAVAVWASADEDDYDCQLYTTSTGQQDGFGLTAEGTSARAAGLIDAVISNQYVTASPSSWDVGIFNSHASTGDYQALFLESQIISSSTKASLSFTDGEMIQLLNFELLSSRVGWNTVTVEITAGSGPLHAAWIPTGFTTGGLEDAATELTTGAGGVGTMSYDVATQGQNCLVVWRDPADLPSGAANTIDYDVSIQLSDGDFVAVAPPTGWHSPLVPLPDASGTPTNVPLPTNLVGDSPSTYFNLSLFNAGLNPSDPVDVTCLVDGNSILTVSSPGIAVDDYSTINWPNPLQISSGRHTLSLRIDPNGVVPEGDETNNSYAEQYTWAAPTISPGTALQRSAPAAITGGWEDALSSSDPLYFNCDGMELQPGTGEWYGLAVLSPDDVDLRLHEVLPGTKAGFAPMLAFSGWGPGQSDFVLVNSRLTTPRDFDIGVLEADGSSPVNIEAVESSLLATDPAGSYGPFPMPDGAILRLHEVYLEPGIHVIDLVGDSGSVSWGLSLHQGNAPFSSKSMSMPSGSSWLGGAGAKESITVRVTEGGYYCVAVWRAVPDVSVSKVAASYTLSFSAATTLYVDKHAIGATPDGLNWCSAFTNLTDALAAALPGMTIRVADGKYTPDTAGLADPREASFQLQSGVSVQGSYAGCGAVDPNARNLFLYRSILSGDLLDDDTSGGSAAENCYHVVTGSNTDATAIFEGFTVVAGNADGAPVGSWDSGGGLFIKDGSPTIRQCVFRKNFALGGGAGASMRGTGTPTIVRCTFRKNTTGADGAGVELTDGVDADFISCEFIDNDSAGRGGGIYNDSANLTVVDGLFLHNNAQAGGGLENLQVNTALIVNSSFLGNTAGTGGAVYNEGGAPVYTGCLFSGNHAGHGGAMTNDASANPLIDDCTIARNFAVNEGGGLYQTSSMGGNPIVQNSIVWANEDSGGIDASAQIRTLAGSPEVYRSCVLGGWTGIGSSIFTSPPDFIDPAGPDGTPGTLDDDLRLQLISPYIDAGNSQMVPADAADVDEDGDTAERLPLDLAKHDRFLDVASVLDTGLSDPPDYPEVVDLGCYESTGTSSGSSPSPIVNLPELGGGSSAVLAGVYDGNPQLGGWSVDLSGQVVPVVWEIVDSEWQVQALSTPGISSAGAVQGMFHDDVSGQLALFGYSEDACGCADDPTLWVGSGQSWQTQTLPGLGSQRGQGFAGAYLSSGDLAIVGIATDAAEQSRAVIWNGPESGPFNITQLPDFGTNSAAVGEELTNTGLVDCIGGWAENSMGQSIPVVWSDDGQGGWALTQLPTLAGGEGRVRSENVDIADLTWLGWSTDANGNRLPVIWTRPAEQWVLTPPPVADGYAEGMATRGVRLNQEGGELTAVGTSYNGSQLDAAATIWSWNAQLGDYEAKSLTAGQGSNPLQPIEATVVLDVGTSEAMVAGTGYYLGAAKSATEPHAFVRVTDATTAANSADSTPTRKLQLKTYPNPFNPLLTMEFELATQGHTSLRIYDVRGRWVATVVDAVLNPGSRSFVWRGRDSAGQPVSSGVYYVRLETPEGIATRKVALVR